MLFNYFEKKFIDISQFIEYNNTHKPNKTRRDGRVVDYGSLENC